MVFREAIKNSIFHEISNYCSANNIESFVVGGFVRDFFLKRPSKDIDILITVSYTHLPLPTIYSV